MAVIDRPETALHFPHCGVSSAFSFWRQPAGKMPVDGDYARTAPAAENVRAYEATTGRRRGGSRSGLSKLLPLKVGGLDWVTQHLTPLVTSGVTPAGMNVPQGSASGRLVYLVSVAQGNVFWTFPGGSAWTPAVNASSGTPPLNYTGVMQSAPNQQKLWFADGINYRYWNPATNTVNDWVATAGTLPRDAGSNTPRLIATYRGRTMLSGLLQDGQNWFASAVGDPTDFAYDRRPTSGTQAVAGNNSRFGLIGDMITALIPFSDDVFFFGGDSSIYLMRGDPAEGGSIDLVTESIGVAWGKAWCQGPDGTIYFFSNHTGVFALAPNQQPQRISRAIDNSLKDTDTGSHQTLLQWDDRWQGFHMWVTPLAAPGNTTHWFWDQRTGGWFPDRFKNHQMDPLCCCTFDGNGPEDRVLLTGAWDGFVRAVDPTATTDDGVAIDTHVFIGPLVTPTGSDLVLNELQAVLGEQSGDVIYEVYAGRTAEAALSTAPVATGNLKAGRNTTRFIRRAGHALYVRLVSSNQWALEFIRVVLEDRGDLRRRGA